MKEIRWVIIITNYITLNPLTAAEMGIPEKVILLCECSQEKGTEEGQQGKKSSLGLTLAPPPTWGSSGA